MRPIYFKELNAFFASLIGYMVIGLFLLTLGLFIWIFPEYAVLDYGYATLDQLFAIAPMVFIFLIPAITMRSFAEELQAGTLEWLNTKPLRKMDLVLGKFLASTTLVVFAILPTLIYYYSIYQLGNPIGNVDSGAILGSYIGLILLGASFVSIGLFASAMTSNQIVAFLLGAFICFLLFFGFYYISKLPTFYGVWDNFVQMLGMDYHFQSIGRGLVDTRDLVYFLSVIALFLGLTVFSLRKK